MQAEKSPTRPGEVRTTVLIVDDEALIRWAASSALTDAGFQVVEAGTVTRALELVDTTPVDLALLDFRLGDGDGVQVLRELHRAQPACRCIMMTAFRTPELSTHAGEDGVIVLDKPFGMSDLVGLVGTVMAAPH